MSRQLSELETILQLLTAEHRKLLAAVEAHGSALRKMDLPAIEAARRVQESVRQRILALETRRKSATLQLTKLLRIDANTTLVKLAELHPPRSAALLKLRAELKTLATAIHTKNHIAGRVAGAVLGHLNTAVRLVAGAVERAGVYTRTGSPSVSKRIGMMEAVG